MRILKKYKIVFNEIKGDVLINNIIRDEIYKNSNNRSKEILKININTNYEKIILSNDTKGSPSEFQLIASTELQIIGNDKSIRNNFIEKQMFEGLDT